MTGSPADILAAARLNKVGPYLALEEEWLKGWTGPAEWLDTFRDPDGRWVVSAYGAGGMANGAPAERLRLDTRRPEVRHLLCDLGIAPEWARKSAVACWCAGMGVEPAVVFPEWEDVHFVQVQSWQRRTSRSGWAIGVFRSGWQVAIGGLTVAGGPETCALGRACANLAALRARCILAEKDGLYVPLADGGIGWWAT